MTSPKISTRTLARTIAAKYGIGLDAAQRAVEASVKSAAAKQAAADAREPVAQRIARERNISIETARALVDRLLSDVDPPTIKGTDRVPSIRSAAKRIAAQRGISLDVAQRLAASESSRRPR